MLKTETYWKLKDRIYENDVEQCAEQVRELVWDAIRRQMVSDVPIGTFLSGGLDSSIITAICAKEVQGEKLNTFSVDYLNNDQFFQPGKFQPNADAAFIDKMRDTFPMNHHKTVLTPEELLDHLQDATLARDLPGMADVDFSLLAFSADVRKHVKVILSGECADEIFGGYPWYRDSEIRERAGFPWSQTTAERIQLMQLSLHGKESGEAYVMDLYRHTCQASDILPEQSALEKRMKEMVNLNFRWFMQTLLDRKDRMSMFCGLEVRVPFCDYRIAELLYTVPWKMKDMDGREKGLLRYAMRDLLPQEIITRKKSPYPKTFDPGYERLVSNRIQALLQEGNSPLFHLINPEQLNHYLQSEGEWPWYGQLMRRPQTIAFFLQLDFWLKAYHVEFLF